MNTILLITALAAALAAGLVYRLIDKKADEISEEEMKLAFVVMACMALAVLSGGGLLVRLLMTGGAQ